MTDSQRAPTIESADVWYAGLDKAHGGAWAAVSLDEARQFAAQIRAAALEDAAVMKQERDAANERAQWASSVVAQAQVFVDTVNALGGLMVLRTRDLVPMFRELESRLRRAGEGERSDE